MNVFEPYGRQVAGAAGYGLGLALARAVIELHEGRIWVEEVAGGGCAFVFEIGVSTGRIPTRSAPRAGKTEAAADDRDGEPTVET